MDKRTSNRRQLLLPDSTSICSLCQCRHGYLSSPAEWKNEQAQTYVLSLNVSSASLICRPCRHDITRALANPSFIPRWRKDTSKISSNSSNCCVVDCSNSVFAASGVATSDEVQHAFYNIGLKCSSQAIPTPTPLCKYHYHLVYKELQSRQTRCKTCGSQLKQTNHRPCPKPEIIQRHLQEMTGFEGEIQSQDRVCLTCYKSHLEILKENKAISTDSDLKQLIDTYCQQIHCAEKIRTPQDVINIAMAKTVVTVGNVLLENRAMLLPSIHSMFTNYAQDLARAEDLQEPPELKSLSSRWVLSELTAQLQHHMVYSCKVRKYGTLVYRTNSDLILLLSEAMWKLRSIESASSERPGEGVCADKTNTNQLDHINHLVHSQIKTFLAKDAQSPFEYDEINLDDLIQQIDPQLWNAICLLTRSTSELRGTSKTSDPLSCANHVKKIRRLFLLCSILYCTDDRCSMPLHTLMTDVIESQGGSALLVRILNRLGVCLSADTLARFVQYKVNTHDQDELKYLKPDTFTVVSADNIDFMHSFARVYCGQQTSSWHGTTVQAAQPLPSLSIPDMSVSSVIDMLTGPPCPPMDPSQVITVTGPPRPPMDPSQVVTVTGPPRPPMDPSQVVTVTGPPRPPMDPSQVVTVTGLPSPPTESCTTAHLLSHKRTERSSPFPSPMKLTRSPPPKTQRRLRTGTERKQHHLKPSVPELVHHHASYNTSLTLADFVMSATEAEAKFDLQKEVNYYMLHRLSVCNSGLQLSFLNIQDYFSLTRATHTEKSQVVYLEVMDAVADCKDTMMQLLHNLQQQFIMGRNMRWLVLEGDAKLYEVVKSLKFEYGEELSWVIPYPGDWHMLMNYQKALMKPYYDAGLKALAAASGYPLAAIQSCSQFKRSHNFILEAWEAMYRVMLQHYIDSRNPQNTTTPSHLLEDIMRMLQSLAKANFSHEFNQHLLSCDETLSKHFKDFQLYVQNLARTDETWRFWVQFVFQDAMAYVSLFLAIRSGDWNLRMASVKSMAAVFTASDHPNYQKLISQHLEDVLTMPAPIITMFQQGAFVVSVSGRSWHSVAIDECHEMLINKDCKTSIVKPLPDYINRIARYIPYRTKSVKNFQQQLLPCKKEKQTVINSAFSTRPNDIKCEQNIHAQIQALETSSMFTTQDTNRGLFNPFTKKEATAGQHHDLLNFRSIGEKEFLLRIASVILKQPSVHAPNRKRRLQTFSERKVTKSQLTQLERDKKLVLAAMKKKMQFSRRTGKPVEKPGEQLIELPLAISDNTGKPLKGQKSYTTRSLQSRYKDAEPQVFITSLPWKPKCSMLEGMFLINTTPLGSQRTMSDYANFLITRFILSQFKRGSFEVHVIFDNPGRLKNTPKYFEHLRRDASAKKGSDHCCDTIFTTTNISKRWREDMLNCRQCKRGLVTFLSDYFLNNISTYLQDHQTLYVAGGFDGHLTDTVWYVQGNSRPQPDPIYTSNAEETDTRIWLHVKQTAHKQILLQSPDTDVYHIGLLLEHHKQVIVQTSPMNSREMQFLDMSALIKAFQNDPDLATINTTILPQVMQTLFVSTGCDYTSFFVKLERPLFCGIFYNMRHL